MPDTAADRRSNPWWLGLTAGFVSSMLPLATLIHGVYQARVEDARKARELELDQRSQLAAQERAWLEIAVDAARPEAQRNQVLRFLSKNEGRVGEWAREEAQQLEKVIEDLKRQLAEKEKALKEARDATENQSAKTLALTESVNSLKTRLGERPSKPLDQSSPPPIVVKKEFSLAEDCVSGSVSRIPDAGFPVNCEGTTTAYALVLIGSKYFWYAGIRKARGADGDYTPNCYCTKR